VKKEHKVQVRKAGVRIGPLVYVLTLFLSFCALGVGIAATPKFWESAGVGVSGQPMFASDGSATTTQKKSPDGVWSDADESMLADSQSPRRETPRSYRSLVLNQGSLESLLGSAPMEFTLASRQKRSILTLPSPDGAFSRFAISESPILPPELAARFPEIKTYVGQGIDDPSLTTRFDWTSTGFHGIILSTRGTVLIEPYEQGSRNNHIVYFQSEMQAQSLECVVTEAEQEAANEDSLKTGERELQLSSSGQTLRTYRLAVAATAEYTQTYGGGTVAGGLSAITTTINLVNAIYERDVAIRLTLIPNETDIIFTDSASDGYTSNNIPSLIAENQTKLDSVIGSANYDIGHVFDGQQLGGGAFSWQGQASIRAVCLTGSKARGVDIFRSLPPTSVYTYYSVAHEIGHQFGGTHTFNTTSGSCGASQRSPSTAYEPANGSTIMAYRLACSPEDLASTDTFFHVASIEQIINNVASGTGSTCGVATPTSNQPPNVAAGPTYTIPMGTPFTLTAAGSDPDSDPLTFAWEEFDLGNPSPPSGDDGTRPIFRSFAPTSSPARTFPRIQNVLSGTQTFGEWLPVTTRTMTFRVTGRDNRTGGGGVAFASTQVNVRADAGPFTVTQPISSSNWPTGSTQLVTWAVANTSNAPVSCANVKISLSTDGGSTFPIILANNTPNDGSELVTIPGTPSAGARVRVEGAGNIFFNISQSFTVSGSSSTLPTITGFTPASGLAGTNVTITGTNFITPSAVLFNGVGASFTVNSTTEIVATVPNGSTSGPITVNTPAGSAVSSSPFTVTPPPSIAITGRVIDFQGNGLPDVTMTFTINRTGNIETRTAQTDVNGNYSSGDVTCANSVGVMPSKGNSVFNPRELVFVSTSCLSGSQTANFALVPPVVISQFYASGGEAGATYRNDFIELFNRGDTTVNLSGWSLQFTSATGTAWTRVNLGTFSLLPGQHYLLQLGSGGAAGSVLPAPDAATGISMSSTGGKVVLLNSVDTLPAGPCPFSNSVVDFVGYGAGATCFEGTAPAPAPGVIAAGRRRADGCVDSDNNGADFELAPPIPRNRATSLNSCAQWQPVTLTPSQVELKSWTFQGRTYAYVKLLFPDAGYRVVNWGQAIRAGNDFTVDALLEKSSGPSVQAVTTTAQIYDLGPLADGNYTFAFKNSGTVVKSFAFTVSSAVPLPNPIDDARQFVKQQYRDFLNREADQAGEDFWADNITKCNDPARRPPGQTVEQCTLRQRETTSGAFFLSPEFQYTGYFVHRIYQGTLGRPPKLSEFLPDAQFVGNGIVVGGQLSGAQINQNKAAFAAQFVNCVDATKYRCAEFKAIYDPLTNQQFVDKLFQTTGVNASASDRAALVDGLNANPATETRASVVQKVVDGINVISEGNQQFNTTYGQAFYNAELNRAFVQLEYFGYMRRDPDEAGYAFWLAKLNQFGGDFVAAEMVLAFISSPEYRARFGPP
jgi:hypothetical protein